MLRLSIFLVATLWGCLTLLIAASLFIVSILPSKGTILITHNLFLDRQDRFEFYDISRQFRYSFTPQISDDAFFVSLAPQGRKMAILNVRVNQFYLSITNYRGENLFEPIFSNNVIDFDEVRWSSDGRYFMFYELIINRTSNIIILDTVSGELVEIESLEGRNASGAWSPDNTQIAYTDLGNNTSISQIWLANIRGEDTQQLTDTNAISYCPTWSPDARTIAYLELLSSGEALRFVNLDGTLASNYPTGIWRMTSCPIWSNNARFIYFIALDETRRRTNIVSFNLQTGTEERLFEVEQTASVQLWR